MTAVTIADGTHFDILRPLNEHFADRIAAGEDIDADPASLQNVYDRFWGID